MGLFTKDIESMNDLFVHQLKDIYYAEKRILKALPDMIDKATNVELKQGFETHLRETEGQIQRLEQVFQLHGVEVEAVKCPAIDGIIDEADDVAGDVDDKQVLDAALVAAAQAVEHYEISRYGTLVAWAQLLGRDDCAELLAQNLAEEKATDEKLTMLAKARINVMAAE
ncbi:ferritin-like domain-containing protein [Azospirillum sp. B4]|uniref:YciE/YciF ferroxidase family protein n=1 Tax=Azospirillum sp. B4 TaxID=95605 RepID=UPI0005C882AD|nr:ferritin-like domain-containing protein [Azospirillum sp. B4]